MIALCLSTLLAALPGLDDVGRKDAQLLLDTVESLIEPVADFRCEYEGQFRCRGKVAEAFGVGDDDVFDSYGGVFIWKWGGDTHIESMHRRATVPRSCARASSCGHASVKPRSIRSSTIRRSGARSSWILRT